MASLALVMTVLGCLKIESEIGAGISRTLATKVMVARERYRFSPHDANLRYFLRSSA
jgi:hypothetical protein